MNDLICCPPFDVNAWNEKKHVWKDKVFIEDSVLQVFHIPLNMGQVITRMWKKIEDAKAAPDTKDFLMLAYDPSMWKSQIYISVTKSVPKAKMAKLSGEFISKVFDGPYSGVPGWIKEVDEYLAGKDMKALKYYFYYTTCPKCAKKYGHNYVVAFAQIK